MIPEEILNKKSTLTHFDWNLIRRHPENGIKILRKLTKISEPSKHIVLHHHERHSGSGYPDGLRSRAIPLFAKICAIADVFEGLTSNRPYKDRQSNFGALKVMSAEMRGEFETWLCSRL